MNTVFLISNAIWFFSLVYLAYVENDKVKDKFNDNTPAYVDLIVAVVYAAIVMTICYVIMIMVKVWVLGVPLSRIFDGLLC